MPRPPVELLRNDYMLVTLEADGAYFRAQRSTQPLPSIPIVRAVYEEVGAVFARAGKTGRGVLIDARSAPGRNDPAFEALMAELRPRIYGGFVRVAVLLRTSIGRLQSQRYTRQDGATRFVTEDEDAAIAYLLGRIDAPRT